MTLALSDWDEFYRDGKSFHKRTRISVDQPQIYTPVLIQNLAAMSIEKYFMAIFMSRGFLPRNHTMFDLLEEIKQIVPISPTLEETLLYMDSLQQICSIDNIKITLPKEDDVPRFIEAVDEVEFLADTLCKPS
jgi:hypothetical protein